MFWKSALSAFLSIVIATMLGYFGQSILGVSGSSGRDITPLAVTSGILLLCSGFIYGCWLLHDARSCVTGMAIYAIFVAFIVAKYGGTAIASFFLGWVALVLCLTLAPWLLGVALGWWSRRKTFK